MGYEGKLQFEDGLRPTASFADFRKMLDKYARHESIMVVGHNPSLSEFLARSISEAGCEAGDRTQKRGSRPRGDESQFRIPDVVPYAQNSAHPLRSRRREFPAKDFQENSSFFFHRP